MIFNGKHIFLKQVVIVVLYPLRVLEDKIVKNAPFIAKGKQYHHLLPLICEAHKFSIQNRVLVYSL